MGLAQAVPGAVALGLQLFVATAADSRCFDLLGPGTGCDTAGELSRRIPTLLMPSAPTFDACAYIVMAELALVGFLLAVGAGLVEAVPAIPDPWLDAEPLWFAANAAQAAASALFVAGRLAGSAVAVAACAAALIGLGASLTPLDPLSSLLLSLPVWLHAGWATAATVVHAGMAVSSSHCGRAAPLATAFAGIFGACGVALATLCLVGTSSLPMVAVVAWVISGIGDANAAASGGECGHRIGRDETNGDGLCDSASESGRDGSGDLTGQRSSLDLTRAVQGSGVDAVASDGREALARAASVCAALLLVLLVTGSILYFWRQAHTWQQYH
jgi:hypothetical protein